MRRTVVLAVAGWVAAVLAATAAGVAAVTLIGRGLVGLPADEPRSQEEIERLLADATPAATAPATTGPAAVPPTPGSTSAPAGTVGPGATAVPTVRPADPATVRPAPPANPAPPPVQSAPKLFNTPGGTVVARCAGGQVTLASWAPAPGYYVDEVRRGPNHQAEVRFERGDDRVEARFECVAGAPQMRLKLD